MNDIKPECQCVCLIKIANLQFVQNKFSYDIVLKQAKVLIEEPLIEFYYRF